MTNDANKLRFYIDQAIMMRDYAALAVFEDRLNVCRESTEEEQDATGETSPPVANQ